MKPTNNNAIDKELTKLMQESRSKASAGFADNVMQQLATKPVPAELRPSGLPQHIFRPLLSWRAVLSFLGIGGAISWLFSLLMAPSTNFSYTNVNSLLQKCSPEFSLNLPFPDGWLVVTLVLAAFLLAGVDRFLKRVLS
jgi:hypothetical protein